MEKIDQNQPCQLIKDYCVEQIGPTWCFLAAYLTAILHRKGGKLSIDKTNFNYKKPIATNYFELVEENKNFFIKILETCGFDKSTQEKFMNFGGQFTVNDINKLHRKILCQKTLPNIFYPNCDDYKNKKVDTFFDLNYEKKTNEVMTVRKFFKQRKFCKKYLILHFYDKFDKNHGHFCVFHRLTGTGFQYFDPRNPSDEPNVFRDSIIEISEDKKKIKVKHYNMKDMYLNFVVPI